MGDGMGRFYDIDRLLSYSSQENATFEAPSRGSLTSPPSKLSFPTLLALNVPLKRTSAQGRQEACLENPRILSGAGTTRRRNPPKRHLQSAQVGCDGLIW